MPRKIYKIQPAAPDHIARAGLTLKAFAERAGIAESTLHALLNQSGTQIAPVAACIAPRSARMALQLVLGSRKRRRSVVEPLAAVADDLKEYDVLRPGQ